MSDDPIEIPQVEKQSMPLGGMQFTSGAAFISAALAAWSLGTTGSARVIEVLSLAAGILGYFIVRSVRRQTTSISVLIGYFAFWGLTLLIGLAWIFVVANGTSRVTVG